MSVNKLLRIASFLIALGIILSAFGAHYLKPILDAYSLDVYNKASFYHITQSLGLFVILIIYKLELISIARFKIVTGLLFFGIFVFSGSLYLLAVTGMKWLGAVTPIGGIAMIIAWLVLATSFKIPKNRT